MSSVLAGKCICHSSLCAHVIKEFSAPLVLPCKDLEGPISPDFHLTAFLMVGYYNLLFCKRCYQSHISENDHIIEEWDNTNKPVLLSQNHILQEKESASFSL